MTWKEILEQRKSAQPQAVGDKQEPAAYDPAARDREMRESLKRQFATPTVHVVSQSKPKQEPTIVHVRLEEKPEEEPKIVYATVASPDEKQ